MVQSSFLKVLHFFLFGVSTNQIRGILSAWLDRKSQYRRFPSSVSIVKKEKKKDNTNGEGW